MTPLVLLPGMMCDARLFGPQIAVLHGPRQVTIGDLTGQDSIVELAQAVLSLAPRRFALAGLSMGGIVAMEMIRQAPERVERLALLDTNPCAETAEMQARRGPQMARVAEGELHTVMRDEMKPTYLADGPRVPDILDLCMAMALDTGADVFARQSRALRDRPDQCDALRGVTVPTLILCGAEDRVCPVARHQLMHDLIPQSELVIVPRAGHLPTLEQPERVTGELTRWLETI